MSKSLQLSDFAPELLHCVFRFCPPSDLASLSQVNTIFRHAVEYLLYRHIHVSFHLFPDTTQTPTSQANKSLFYTLMFNPQKAALLRYLHVQLEFDGNHVAKKFNNLLLEQIVDALRNAHGLVDLRIMVFSLSDVFKGRLSEVIKGGHFQLHTLYCDSYQDLEGIIVTQKHLHILGICPNIHSGYLSVLTLIKNRRHSRIDRNRSFPGIFLLTYYPPLHNLSRLTLFPELCLPGQALTLCRDIASSMGRGLGKPYEIMPVDNKLAIHVFDFSYAKTDIIFEVVDAIAQCFVDCQNFRIWVQTSDGEETVTIPKPWRIPGVSTSIRRFKQLRCLDFYVSEHDSLPQTPIDLRSFLIEENFVHTGLMLVRLWLDNQSVFALLLSEYGWEALTVGD